MVVLDTQSTRLGYHVMRLYFCAQMLSLSFECSQIIRLISIHMSATLIAESALTQFSTHNTIIHVLFSCIYFQ